MLEVLLGVQVFIEGSSRISQKLHTHYECLFKMSVILILMMLVCEHMKSNVRSYHYLTRWGKPFEVISNSSGAALGVVLGKRRQKILNFIYYSSEALNVAKRNSMTEQYIPALVFSFEKFLSYLLGSKVNAY